MVKESPRKCSHCGLIGHNSRTCSNGARSNHCVKLFGVNLMEKNESDMRKCLSMGNLRNACNDAVDQNNNIAGAGNVAGADNADDAGYLSDGLIHNKKCKAAHERKKGKPWSRGEHRTFLDGLKRLGKGDWRGISKNFVTSRTPTQVASHAQKYFLRKLMNGNENKKRRSSLFDMPDSKNDGPQDRQASSSMRTREIPKMLLPKKSSENQQQVINLSTQLINRFPHLCLDTPYFVPPATAASSGLANLHGIAYIVGVCPKVAIKPLVHVGGRALVAVVPQAPRSGSIGHPSGIPSPRSSSSSPNTTALQQPSDVPSFGTDALELKIGLPQTSQSTNGAIRVI